MARRAGGVGGVGGEKYSFATDNCKGEAFGR
jgi:hypothetical protein